jgi:hypothetical protein
MSDEPANLVLLALRRLEIKLDRLSDDMADVKIRLTNVEEGVSGVNRRLDRVDTRLDRVERRLELREPIEP